MFYNKAKDLWQEYIDVDGERRRISSKSKAGLTKKLLEYGNKKEHGELFETVADLWAEKHEEKIELTTSSSYKPHVTRAKEFFSGEHVNDITPAECQAYIDELVNRGYARDTVSRARHILTKIFNFAITLPGSTLRDNPVSAVETPRGLHHTRREPPTEDQLVKINPESEMGLFACFLLYTGLRRGEMLALKWEDIDFKEKTINICRVVQYDDNNGHIKDKTKTAAGMRVVPLPEELLSILPKGKKHGYIFGGEKWLPLMTFYRNWVAWCSEVGLAEKIETKHTGSNNHTYTKTKWKPLVTPHQFRHQYATMLYHAGVDELDTKNIMGHSSIVVTRDIYQHISERDKESNAASKINDYYANKGKTETGEG